MLRPLNFEAFKGIDLVPQAIIKKPPSYFHEKLGIEFVDSYDDLDRFDGALLALNGDRAFALKHYRGEPADTTTVYLSRDDQDVETISAIVNEILRALEISPDAVVWQRSDNPEL